MINVFSGGKADSAFRVNPLSAVRVDAPGGRPAALQWRALAPKRSWLPLTLSGDGRTNGLFSAALGLLEGRMPETLTLGEVGALWRAGILLSPSESLDFPEIGATEVEFSDAPLRPWAPPEAAGAALWRRLFPDFDRIVAAVSPSVPSGASDRLTRHLPVFLPDLLAKTDAAAAASVWRRLCDAGLLVRNEHGFRVNNDPLARALMRRLGPAMEEATGRPLRESYTYAMCYEPGAWLRRHVDRKHCEYTLSLFLDYLPASDHGGGPWALNVETGPNGESEHFFQQPGDGVLFRGHQIFHGRPPLPDGHRSLVLMLHWVDADFPDDQMDRS